MRPLPSYEPLPPQPSVYDPNQDSFLSVLADQFNQLDQLNGSLSGEVDAALGYESGIGGSIDALDSTLSDAIDAFDLLQAEDTAMDLTGMIADAFSLDSQLVSNFDSWGPDIGALAANWLGDLFKEFIVNVVSIFEAMIQKLWDTITAWVETYVNELLSQFFNPGQGGGTQ